MKKPDWKDAPEWARYLAQDKNCNWYWYENKPTPDYKYWVPDRVCRTQMIDQEVVLNPNWKDTLEERPTTESKLEEVRKALEYNPERANDVFNMNQWEEWAGEIVTLNREDTAWVYQQLKKL